MIHIFDVDYTLVRRSTSWYFLLEALGQKVIRFRQIRRLPFEWFRYKAGFPNQDFIEETVKHLKGINQDVLEDLAESCFIRRLRPNIYTGGRRLIEEIRRRGEPVLLASSSFYTLLRPLEQFLGITESIASRLEFIDGTTSGRLTGASLFGVHKKTAVERWLEERNIPPEEVCFYSDSYTDIPLLEWCGHPSAVNPDRLLAREAKSRGWNILRFRETEGRS
jgi:HAD superfamily hydrolase (TIGR01490 family)